MNETTTNAVRQATAPDKSQVIYGYFGTTDPAEPTETDAVVRYVQDRISQNDIGLDADDPLFWHYSAQAPVATEAGDPITLNDQIEWAVSNTRAYHDKILTKRCTQSQYQPSGMRRVKWPQQNQMPAESIHDEIATYYGGKTNYTAAMLASAHTLRVLGDFGDLIPSIRALVRVANRAGIFVHLVLPTGTNLDGVELPGDRLASCKRAREKIVEEKRKAAQ